MNSPCANCEAPTGDGGNLCAECTAGVLADLAWLPELFAVLEVTMTRQDQIQDDRPAEVRQLPVTTRRDLDPQGRPWPGTLAPTALPFHVGAAELSHAVPATLGSWCRLLDEELHPDDVPGATLPEPEILAMTSYLAARAPWWRMQSWSSDLQEELHALVRAVERTVDRRDPQAFLGPCTALLALTTDSPGQLPTDDDAHRCGAYLYAEYQAAWVECRNCGARYDVASRREWLLEAAQDRLAHAELIASALSGLGVDVNVDQVRGWARHGRMDQHGIDTLGRKLFRVGDAVAIAMELAAKGRKPRARKAS